MSNKITSKDVINEFLELKNYITNGKLLTMMLVLVISILSILVNGFMFKNIHLGIFNSSIRIVLILTLLDCIATMNFLRNGDKYPVKLVIKINKFITKINKYRKIFDIITIIPLAYILYNIINNPISVKYSAIVILIYSWIYVIFSIIRILQRFIFHLRLYYYFIHIGKIDKSTKLLNWNLTYNKKYYNSFKTLRNRVMNIIFILENKQEIQIRYLINNYKLNPVRFIKVSKIVKYIHSIGSKKAYTRLIEEGLKPLKDL